MLKQFGLRIRITLFLCLYLVNVKAQCNPPIVVLPTNVYCDSVAFSWPVSGGAISYTYAVDQSPSNPTGTQYMSIGPVGNKGGLNASTTYYIHVRSNCTGIPPFSPWTSVSFTTTSCACATPNGLTVVPSSTSATFSWNTVSGALNYEYIIDQSSTAPTVSGTTTTSTSSSASGLLPSTTYYLHVRTYCGPSNYSQWASALSFTTSAASCGIPTGISVNPSSNGASFQWNSISNAIAYEYIVDQSSTSPLTSGSSTTATSSSIANLTAATQYYLHLRTQCSISNFSQWATPVPFNTPQSCSTPNNISTIPGNSNVILNWLNIPGATSYEYVVDQNISDPIMGGIITSNTNVNVSGLLPATSYYVHLRTLCNTIYSNWSQPIFFTTTSLACNEPTNISQSTIHHGVQFGWSNVSGATGFRYIVDQSFTEPIGIGQYTAVPTVDIINLQPVGRNYFHLRTQCNSQFSNWITTEINNTTSIKDNIENRYLRVFPNPASNIITLSVEGFNGTAKFEISDVIGNKIFMGSFSGSVTEVDISHYVNGLYSIRIITSKKIETVNFLKY